MKNTKDIANRIRNGDQKAFELAFRQYYQPLVNLANGILYDPQLAEGKVQEVFVTIWEKRGSLQEDLNLFGYLMTSVRNRCLNHIRKKQTEQKYIDHTREELRREITDFSYEDTTDDLEQRLHATIAELPDKCREVFKLSRFEKLSHKEIAARLDISTKTIERHITRAMKYLKQEMGHLAKILFILLGDIL